MNVKSFHTVDYENKSNWKLGKNKANTKPIKPNFPDAQMNVSSVKTMNYEQIAMNNANKNKPNQTQPVVSLPAVSKVEPSNLFQRQKKCCCI